MASKFFKEYVVKPAVKKVKSILKGGNQKTTGTEVIKSFKAKVNKTKLDEARSSLNISIQKTKGSTGKLRHTMWQSRTGDHKKKGFTFDKRNERTKTSDEKRYEEAQIKKD